MLNVLLIVSSLTAVQSGMTRPPTKSPTFTPTSAPTYDYSCLHATSWLVNTNGQYSNKYSSTSDITTSAFVNTTTATTGWKATFTGIPFYGHTFTASEITSLNSRPDASSDFTTGQTTAVAGTYYEFGADIGYESTKCTDGYWPSGPGCPEAQNGTYTFPVFPSPETGDCYVTAHIGYFVNGVPFWSWSDTTSYNSEGVWYGLAMKFEQYDMDICVGHSASGIYHHHSVSPCLMYKLNDTGHSHSPVHGFAPDGYPIYGPYQAANTLAVSCWQARDYSSSSVTGCSDGQRSCTLVDAYDYTQGTVTTSLTGPDPSGTVDTQSGQTISAASGCYFQDFYFNDTCAGLGSQYLDSHNGHSHGSYGYHYHVTMDSDSVPTFPYTMGPKYYGCLPNDGNCQTAFYSGISKSKCTTDPTQRAGSCTKYEYSPAISYPTMAPTASYSPTAPTISPTANPTTPTVRPTKAPSAKPTTIAPSATPSSSTTISPSLIPTLSPTAAPTVTPTRSPTVTPSLGPSLSPTVTPTLTPTVIPTLVPSTSPTTLSPTASPTTTAPTVGPTVGPSLTPTKGPTLAPSMLPTVSNPPTESPTIVPSALPTITPTASPSVLPTLAPSQAPSEYPSLAPSAEPTISPTVSPSEVPTTIRPTLSPSVRPSRLPSVIPSARPSPGPGEPTYNPTLSPSLVPSQSPSFQSAPILSFTTSTTLSGLTSDTLDEAAQDAFVNATATALGVSSSYVTYSGSTVESRRRLLKIVLTTYIVTVTTDVVIPLIDFTDDNVNATVLYTAIKSSFDSALSNGNFIQYLTAASEVYESDSTLDTTVVSHSVSSQAVVNVPTFQPSQSPESDGSSNSSGLQGTALYLVIGLVGGGGGLLLIIGVVYCFMRRSQTLPTSSAYQESPPPAVTSSSESKGTTDNRQVVSHHDNTMGF